MTKPADKEMRDAANDAIKATSEFLTGGTEMQKDAMDERLKARLNMQTFYEERAKDEYQNGLIWGFVFGVLATAATSAFIMYLSY